MTGVYAATNSAAAPALGADGAAVEDSVPRVLRVRGQALDLAEASPELAAAQRAGERRQATVGQSGMASMPGAAAPSVIQPVAPALETGPAPDDDPAAPSADAKEEGQ